MAGLQDPLGPVIGAKAAKRLAAALDLRTVGELLQHYPRRYENRGELTDIASLTDGENVTVQAEVASVTMRTMRNRPGTIFEAIITDGRGRLALTFFGRGRQGWREEVLKPGVRGLFAGQVSTFRGKRQLSHPEYELLGPGEAVIRAADYAAEIIPVYPAVKGITSWQIADSIRLALDLLDVDDDLLPRAVRDRYQLSGLADALRGIHRPADRRDADRARQRLKWDEAFVLQVILAQRRRAAFALSATPRAPQAAGLLAEFDAALPFELTVGQQLAGATIADELARDHPMHRLLQGEVGSGKTVVALRAMLTVVDGGGQAALLAPTEVLAAQHHRSMTAMLGDLAAAGMLGGDERATRVVLLTGSMPTAARRRALLEAVSGDAGIVVGTHALLQENVAFCDLGLVVVDEQHRFGVEQRDALKEKGRTTPHLLVMTATPIPRTVAMTVFGDLETSTLRELPAGRSPIATHVVPVGEKPGWYERTWTRLREEAAEGHQAYVVCPRIGGALAEDDAPVEPVGPAAEGEEAESVRRPARAVLEVLDELRAHPALTGLRIEPLHGRLPADERDATMRAFAAGDVQVLVATTVIEVGVDVANATAMVVLDADRFGVSQLHQLRGRVGRGSAAGLCLLVSEAEAGTPARQRLDAVAATLDGFELARVDLEQRREGDVLGARQSGGRSSLRLLRVLRDEQVIEAARHEAVAVVAADSDLAGHPAL